MARLPYILDEEVDYGFEGGPRYSTGKTEMENGFVEKDSEWNYGRHEYSASFGNITDEDRDAIISTFHACRGSRHSFLFKDWNDYIATLEPLNVPAEYWGTTNPVQLYKTYTFMNRPLVPGEPYTIRPIQAIKMATVYEADGVTAVPGTVDLDTGLFTPTAPWANDEASYFWSGEFYVWVSFEDDYNPMTINSWRANTASVTVVEDKFFFTPTNVPAHWEPA